jgi:fibronectin type 3 domain-containing protein
MVQREVDTGKERRMPRLGACGLAVPALLVALLLGPSAASADRSYAPRFTTTDRGQVVMAANTVMSCPSSAAGCSAARAGTSSDDNGDFAMTYTDVDGDSTTFNSSRSTLALPSGSTVLFAGLYWGGDTSAGDNGDDAPLPAARAFVRFTTPTASARTITASALDIDATSSTRYQAFADVTSLVQAAGNGAYTVGAIEAGTGVNRYGGWGLVVAYRNPAEPTRRLVVYDGLLPLQPGLRPTADVSLSGFVTPPSGTVRGRLAMLSWEGDRGLTGDSATFAGRSLSDASNPVTNVFNSSVSRAGVATTGRTPSYANLLGVDADELTIDGFLGNSASSASLHLATGTDLYLPGAIGLAFDEGPPRNTSAPTTSGTARDGQTLTADPGVWDGSGPIAYTYQWRRCDASGADCADVAGATSATYALGPSDVGPTMRVVATATNAAGATSATSAASAKVAATPPVNQTSPSLAGSTRDGETLTADRGSWTGTPTIGYAYQWRRCDAGGAACADIAGATAATYKLAAADVGATVRVVVTATNAAAATAATSGASGRIDPVAPSNTAAPSLSGTARDGQTLTVDKGTWSGTPAIAYAYQWRRCDTSGGSCADIAGATGATYALTSADAGATVRVVVTATNAAGSTHATAASALVAPAAPANTTAPAISGTTRDGQTVTADRGTWTGTPPIAYAYRWRRCDTSGASCVDIAGATSAAYALTAADVGATLRVVVTAANAAGATAATSNASAKIAAAPPVSTTAASFSGATRDGETLTAERGAWTGTPPLAYTYQWRRCDAAGANCADIAGATNATYALTSTDVGTTTRLVVTATNAAGSASSTSTAGARVNPTPPVNTASPTISGTARDGQTLTVDTGTWAGTPTIGYAYQWRRCDSDGTGCADIAEATATTYRLTAADVGSTVRVVVTATNAAGAAPATSAASARIDPTPPVNTAAPAIAGTARDGQALTVDTGTWTGTPTIAYGYQWRRCDAAGANCADVPGATGRTYTLDADDVGRTLRSVVTATNAAGATPATSGQTATIAPTAPIGTTAPSISGTARDGETLTVDRGRWTGTPAIAYTYQWRRCDGDGANCADVAGATDQAYTLTAADTGRTIVAVVTAWNAAGATSAAAPATAPVKPAPPVNTTAPTVTGTVRDGEALTVTRGAWSGTEPLAFAYQWRRCGADAAGCNDIPGATATTYALTAADVGRRIRVTVTATNAAGSATAGTDPTDRVVPAPPASRTAPVVSGTARDGSTLTAQSEGQWDGTAPIAFDYAWLRCDGEGASCATIPGATSRTYALDPDDVGHVVRVRVTASNDAGAATRDSAGTDPVAPVAPSNVARPTIDGVALEGRRLSADTGTWTGTPRLSFSYQWQRCDGSGADCADIAGATGATYTTTAADTGNRVRVVVTATNAAGTADAASAPASVDPAAPVPTAPPTISGTARDGETLTADPGTWDGTRATFTYQWVRCDSTGTSCTDIDGATSRTYGATADDVGGRLAVRVHATNAAGAATNMSTRTDPVAAVPPAATQDPTVAGEPRDGATLTADPGRWTGTQPIAFAFRWRRCDADGAGCADIDGATDERYTAGAADVGHTLRVAVTATNAGGSVAATSSGSDTVAPAPPANTAAPTVPGAARDGAEVTADPGDWTGTAPIRFAYQWQRCAAETGDCTDIPGADGRTYTPASADVGAQLRAVVTATNDAGSATAASSPTAAVAAVAPDPTAAPSIDGPPRDGATLTADTGSWSGTTPIAFAYQWRRCDGAGQGCADISGATARTYVATAADVARTVRVVVTATNVTGSARATSEPTAAVDAVAPSVRTGPAIDGSARDGEALTADPGTWDGTQPMTFAYQWRRCDADGAGCADVDGANDPTYTLTGNDVGGTMRVVVTARNAGGSHSSVSAASDAVAAAPPVSEAAPSIDGTGRDGETLTADPGRWSGTAPLAFAYRWQRCDAAGADCDAIDGADGRTYTATGADVGHALRVVVTARNDGGTAAALAGPTASVAPAPPVSEVAPGIDGTARDGATLTADRGTWTGTEPIGFAYQWQRCDADGSGCTDIAGATERTYEPTAADVGHALRVAVTASNAAGSSAAPSDPTAAVAAVAPSVRTAPSVEGTPRDAQTLTADPGTWDGTTPVRFAYQWQRCNAHGCSDVAGATERTYEQGAADVGRTLRVVVTATNAGGSANAASERTGDIGAAAPVNAGAPAIDGTARDGETLTADPGRWGGTAPVAFEYRWQRCDATGDGCEPIAGADGRTYTATAEDVDHALRVVVTARNDGGTQSATSAPTPAVGAQAPANTATPTVTGAARDGGTLVADPGEWTGTAPIAFAYQWERCDGDGRGCEAIPGATDRAYELAAADLGRGLHVVVTAANAGGSDRATSGMTAPVAPVAPDNTAAPSIAGPTRAGATLTATAGTWTGTQPVTFAYQWLRCDETCREIPGATGSAYVTTESDVGATIRVAVTATNAAGSTTATSAPTDGIGAVPPTNVEPPAISGIAIDGQTLTAGPGRWEGTPPIDFGYRWRRCDADGEGCTTISGATGATYTATSADVGHTLRVLVAATNPGGTDTVTSAASPEITPRPPENTTRPTIDGTARDGETLTAQPGAWDGTEPIRFAYQWQRCTAGACADIDGAADRAYTVTSRDYAATLRVVVRATNDADSASATSPATASVAAIPTRSTAPPAIDGTRRVGQLLAAVAGHFDGTGPLTLTYQWQRCDADGTDCDAIPGATGGNYTAVAADAGHALRVAVTAAGPGGDDTATSAPTTPIEALPAPDAAPENTAPPTIHGPAVEGVPLEVEFGTWTGTDPIDRAYRWQRCDADGSGCAGIEGATTLQYVPTPDDVGKRLRVTVIARNDAGTGEATSELTDRVVARPPENTATPSISGRPHVGVELTADKGAWTGTADIAYAYQWLRCAATGMCIEIAGATRATYTPVSDDANAALRVRVTARNDVGAKSVESAPTAPVAADPPRNTTPPAITGTPRVGETLAVDPGVWTGSDPLTPTYQWQRCDPNGTACADIASQTERMYVATADDEGRTLRVVVRVSGPGGTAAQASAPTAVVAPRDSQPTGDPPDNTVPPTISGTPRPGATLQVDRGHWTGTEPIAFGYQWRRCDAGGNGCVDIDGATSLQYVVTSADVGHTLRVVARGTNGYGTGEIASRPTALVTATSAAGGGATPVPAPAPAATPAPSAPVTPGAGSAPPATPGASGAGDLSVLPDSQISSTACATLTGGGGFRRVDLAATGAVRMRIRADATVLPTTPVVVTVNAARPAGLRAVRYTLDGRALRAGTRSPYRVALAPASLKPGRHVLAATLRPSRGATRVLRATLRVAGCATRFAARHYRTTAGTGLRLRVDSRTATRSVTVTVPAAIARGLALGTPSGRIRIVTASGRRQFTLSPARAGTPAGLTAAAGRPGVKVRGRTIAVTNLPASTGIVELTVYQPRPPRGAALLPRGARVNAIATVRGTATRRVLARVSSG